VHHMLRAAEISPRGAVQPLVRLRSMLRADARVSLLPRACDDVARPAPCVITRGKLSVCRSCVTVTARLASTHYRAGVPQSWV